MSCLQLNWSWCRFRRSSRHRVIHTSSVQINSVSSAIHQDYPFSNSSTHAPLSRPISSRFMFTSRYDRLRGPTSYARFCGNSPDICASLCEPSLGGERPSLLSRLASRINCCLLILDSTMTRESFNLSLAFQGPELISLYSSPSQWINPRDQPWQLPLIMYLTVVHETSTRVILQGQISASSFLVIDLYCVHMPEMHSLFNRPLLCHGTFHLTQELNATQSSPRWLCYPAVIFASGEAETCRSDISHLIPTEILTHPLPSSSDEQ